MKHLLTGIRDLDREIVSKLDDSDLLNMCSLNKTYSQRVLNDSYFRLRTENGFPETIHYKDYVRLRTWKNHYFNVIQYISLLQKQDEYTYKPEDKSPELLYLSRRIVPGEYTKDKALMHNSRKGNLAIVKYLTENAADIHFENNISLRVASEKGYLEIVRYLVEHGADIHARNNSALILASENGHLPVVEYLVEHGVDVTADDNQALISASLNGKLLVVKYLVEHGADITAQDNDAVRQASLNKHLELVKYLISL